MRTIIEPFIFKVVEPIPLPDRAERCQALCDAHYNLFALQSRSVTFDLLTDSGTSAMSAAQWAAMMNADESYAGSDSFRRFEAAVQTVTGYTHIIPVHQGRAGERILFGEVGGAGKVVPCNSHFDTTRANVEATGAEALDLPVPEAHTPAVYHPFKGNMDLEALEDVLQRRAADVPLVLMTVTNNTVGGQPVSLENLRAVAALCERYGVPMWLDAARFAENAYLIKQREDGQSERTAREIAEEMFSLAAGCLMSAKKDAFANIGGFIAMNDPVLAAAARNSLILTEGFPTYGGLAGRDLDAIAVGLEEVLEERYLEYRIRSVAYFASGLCDAGIPVVTPAGGHAVYLDARAALPHIPPAQLPAQALACALYEEIGIRGVEVGSVMLGRRDPDTEEEILAPMDLVRLALPRRVYTQSHVDYMVEAAAGMMSRAGEIGGLAITWQPEVLRHFTARFRRV
jgi:tyrosine phenol-lyase